MMALADTPEPMTAPDRSPAKAQGSLI